MRVIIIIPYTHTFKSGKKVEARIRADVRDNNTIVTHTKPTGGTERMGVPTEALVRLAESIISNKKVHADVYAIRKQQPLLTIGYRAVIDPASKSWKEYRKHHVILTNRSSGGNFSCLLLGEGVGTPIKVNDETIKGEIAWVSEDDLILYDMEVSRNIKFYDRYKELKDMACPDCGHLDQDNLPKEDSEGDLVCYKCHCRW
jgi:hypothetical protein